MSAKSASSRIAVARRHTMSMENFLADDRDAATPWQRA